MKKRRFFILSLSLASLGLCTHLLAMGYVSRSLQLRTLAISKPAVERIQLKVAADNQLHQIPFYEYLSIGFAIVGGVFLVISARRHEPARHYISFTVLLVYVMSHFILI